MWFTFESGMLSFGQAATITRVAYSERDLVDLDDLAEWRIPAETFAPRRGSTQRVIDERVRYFAPSDHSGTFVVITPEGRPGRTLPIAFVDVALLDSDAREVLGR
jgi:hypothetical protein